MRRKVDYRKCVRVNVQKIEEWLLGLAFTTLGGLSNGQMQFQSTGHHFR